MVPHILDGRCPSSQATQRSRANVRGVFGNMHSFKREKGSAFVRIVTTGHGMIPHYRVSPDTRPMLELVTEDAKALDPPLLRDLYIAFNGRNHRQLPYGAKELTNEHWSATAFTHICQTSATGSVHPHSSVCDGQL